MTKYLDIDYINDRLNNNHYSSKVWQDAYEARETLRWQYTVYGNHTTKQIMESYTEYADDLQFAM